MGLSSQWGDGDQTHSLLVRARLRNCLDKLDLEGRAICRRVRLEIDALRVALPDGRTRPLPDFLIIGAPKCGTTWLARMLAERPGLRVVRGEVEYFSSHLDRPLSWYLGHFESLLADNPNSNCRPLLGEKSASYCVLSPIRIGLVRRLLPEARLILMIRDPVARHWAHAKRFFGKKKATARGYTSLESRAQLREFFIRTRRFSEFSTVIKNWTDIYPSEQLLVISQEATRADPQASLGRVLRHIGAAAGTKSQQAEPVLQTAINEGPTAPMPADVARYLERMFAGERERLDRVLRTRFASEVIREFAPS